VGRGYIVASWACFALGAAALLIAVASILRSSTEFWTAPFLPPALLLPVAIGAPALGLELARRARRRAVASRAPALGNGGVLAGFLLALPLFAFSIFAAYPHPSLSVKVWNATSQEASGRLEIMVVTDAGVQVDEKLFFNTTANPEVSWFTNERLEGTGRLTLQLHLDNGTTVQKSWSWPPGCGPFWIHLMPTKVEFTELCAD
jgi:hypothetical protein